MGLRASAAILASLCATGPLAQPAEAAPALPLWEAGAFGFGASSPAYPGADSRVSTALVLPYFVYRGAVLRADRGTFGARMLRTDRYEFDVGFAAALGASSRDVKVREGMPDLGVLAEFGPRIKVNLAQFSPSSRLRVELPLRAVLELRSGVHGRGYTFSPELVYEDRLLGAGWGVNAGVSVVWGDRRLQSFLYGVAPEFATAARPAFDARAGLITTRASVSVSRALGPDVRVFALARVDNTSGAANRASPLHLSSSGATFGVGLAWTLARSERPAAD